MRVSHVKETLRQGESSEKLVKRFFKKCKKLEITKEYLERTSFFKTKSQKRKDKIIKNRFLKQKIARKTRSIK